MVHRYRFALRPGWLALYTVCAAAILAMVLLGRWQLRVSESKHFSIQNFGYALQWWAFSIFVFAMVIRLLRDTAHRADVRANPALAQPRPDPNAPVAYRRYVMPSTPTATDPVHSAYNEYLAQLKAEDDRKDEQARQSVRDVEGPG